jgi:hypothetical protein
MTKARGRVKYIDYYETSRIDPGPYGWYGPKTTEELDIVIDAIDSGLEFSKEITDGIVYDLQAGIRKFGTRIKGSLLDTFEYKGRIYEEFFNLACVDIRPAKAAA